MYESVQQKASSFLEIIDVMVPVFLHPRFELNLLPSEVENEKKEELFQEIKTIIKSEFLNEKRRSMKQRHSTLMHLMTSSGLTDNTRSV